MNKLLKLAIRLGVILWLISSVTLVSATPFKQWVDSIKTANCRPLAYTEEANRIDEILIFGDNRLITLWGRYNEAKVKSSVPQPVKENVDLKSSNEPQIDSVPLPEESQTEYQEIDLDVFIFHIDYDELISLYTLEFGDSLVANKGYSSIKVKGKNFSLTDKEFDSLVEEGKLRPVKNRVWKRIASNVKWNNRKIGKRTAAPSLISGYSLKDSIINLFKGNPCKRGKR